MTIVEPYNIIKNNIKSSNLGIFKITKYCIILSLATMGFGDHLLGINLSTNFSTIFIFLAFFIQLSTKTIHISKFLYVIYVYIFIQTYILNIDNISLYSSLKQFFGFILFSLSLFSFISEYRDRIANIIQAYYKFVIIVTSFSIIQMLLFVFIEVSFIPQNLLTTNSITGNTLFTHEIFNIFPRAIGLYREPAHYAIICLPGVYIAILVLIDRAKNLQIHNKAFARIILIGFLLSFSFVGYFGLLLCIFSIFRNKDKGKIISKISILLFLFGALYFISQTKQISKITSLPIMFTNLQTYKYKVTDLSGFALASNLTVAIKGLEKSNYLGTGLNSHKETYDELIYNLFSSSQVIMELNKEDSGSLFIRIISEFGIPGILALFIFFIHFMLGRKIEPSSIKTINEMCLVVLVSYCARNGQYLSVNFFLFSALYYYSFKIAK